MRNDFGPWDFAKTAVPQVGRLLATGDVFEPYRLLSPGGEAVAGVSAFFADLLASGRSEATLRSYGMDLLRWFRFLWALGVVWDRATREEARDFCLSLQVGGKPLRLHWRKQGQAGAEGLPTLLGEDSYAPSVRAHSETVLRSFYEYHREAATGPIMNPFPLDRSRRAGRANAHHNPMEAHIGARAGLYRPRVPARVPRAVPDEVFNEIFARLAALGQPGRRRPGPPVGNCRTQGDPGGPRAPGLGRRFRVATPLPGRSRGPSAKRTPPTVVVDAAASFPPPQLSSRPPYVRAGEPPRGQLGDAARAPPHCRLQDGRGP